MNLMNFNLLNEGSSERFVTMSNKYLLNLSASFLFINSL